jgi:hypothetical protein
MAQICGHEPRKKQDNPDRRAIASVIVDLI